jgi:hypothetical protein
MYHIWYMYMDRILRLTTPVIERIGALLIMVPIQHTPLRHIQA